MSGHWRIDPERDRQARPCRDRDRRGAPARAQRSTPLRLARPRPRPTRSTPIAPFVEDGAGAARRRISTAPIWRGRSTAGRAPIKALLLDQRIVAGLGNIYVCEALNLARIAPGAGRRPDRPRAARPAGRGGQGGAARRRSRPAARRLRDYVRPDGELGYFSKRVAGLRPRGRSLSALRRGRFAAGSIRAARPSSARNASADSLTSAPLAT